MSGRCFPFRRASVQPTTEMVVRWPTATSDPRRRQPAKVTGTSGLQPMPRRRPGPRALRASQWPGPSSWPPSSAAGQRQRARLEHPRDASTAAVLSRSARSSGCRSPARGARPGVDGELDNTRPLHLQTRTETESVRRTVTGARFRTSAKTAWQRSAVAMIASRGGVRLRPRLDPDATGPRPSTARKLANSASSG